MIELVREYREDGAFGQMTLEDGSVFATVERPDLGNQRLISCIPEGVYELRLRDSEVVSRTTRGSYLRGWEVKSVPNRTFIMIHVANLPTEVEGCIGIGLKHGFLAGNYGVLSSRIAFDRLMNKLSVRNQWFLEIKSLSPSKEAA